MYTQWCLLHIASSATTMSDADGRNSVAEALERSGRCPVFIERPVRRAADRISPQQDELRMTGVGEQVDVFRGIRGDGSRLWVVRQLGVKLKPIAAINTGTLGFLTCATEEESGALVDALVSGPYTISERLLLAGVGDGHFFR